MRRVLGAVVVLGVLALSGCGGGDPLPTLPPTPSSTPIFASEEEALAAAEDAYAAYSEIAGLIAAEGGREPERIAPYVTPSQLEQETATAEFYQANGVRAVGVPVTILIELQQLTQTGGEAEVVVYVCVDVSQVAVLNAEGSDVTPSDREPIVPLEVVLTGSTAHSLLIASSEQWSGYTFC